MGYLDDLKRKQAAANAPNEKRPKEREERNLPAHVLSVEPRLETLRERLATLVASLNAELPDVSASYQIGAYANLSDLKQLSYEVTSEDRQGLWVQFKFLCQNEQTVQFEIENRETCDKMLDKLLSNGLKVHYRSHADWKFLFTLNSFVPVSLTFMPHESKPAIKLNIHNFTHIGEKVETLAPERLDGEFFDQLQKAVLRKPNRFNELCGNQVTENVRAQFQERIAARKRERETTEEKRPSGLRGLLGKFGKNS